MSIVDWDDSRIRGKRACRCGHAQAEHARHDGGGRCCWADCRCEQFAARDQVLLWVTPEAALGMDAALAAHSDRMPGLIDAGG